MLYVSLYLMKSTIIFDIIKNTIENFIPNATVFYLALGQSI